MEREGGEGVLVRGGATSKRQGREERGTG